MRRQSHIETEPFDRALSEAFQGDPACGAFGTIDDLRRRRMINDLLHAATQAEYSTKSLPNGRKDRTRRLALGAAAAALAFAILGGVLFGYLNSRDNAVPPSPETYFGEVQAQEGIVWIGGRTAQMHAPLPVGKSIRVEDGAASLRLPTGIEWRMENHSEGRIAFLDDERLEVKVLSGESWFRVNPMRVGPAFSVSTKMGRIEVTGTIFAVNAGPSEVRVTLLKGEVWVIRASGERNRVKTGYALEIGEGRHHALAPEEVSRLQHRLHRLDWQPEAAPETALPSQGSVALGAENADTRVEHTPRGEGSVPKAGSHDIMVEIQTQRKLHNWGRVAALYRRLIQSSPTGETAIVSRVSLGEVYLNKLHQHNEALSQFDKYLRTGHTALVPEALYGRCNALKALGQTAQERRCLDRFTRQFPGALRASDARARLDALRSQSPI